MLVKDPKTSERGYWPAMLNRSSLGVKVKAARIAKGLTLRAAAPLCGLSFQQLSAIENGTQNTTIDTIEEVQRGLDAEMLVILVRESGTRDAILKRFAQVLPGIPEEDLGPFLAQLDLWERRYLKPGE